jgi:hypothetical protein
MVFFCNQSPQLCESDPTFWIVNGVVGLRAAACAPSQGIAPYHNKLSESETR